MHHTHTHTQEVFYHKHCYMYADASEVILKEVVMTPGANGRKLILNTYHVKIKLVIMSPHSRTVH